MSHRIYNRIRDVIENTPGLTQKGLAEHMGLNPAAVNRLLHGRRNLMAEEVPLIEDYLGVRLELSAPANIEYPQNTRRGDKRGLSDVAAQSLPMEPPMVPVYSAVPENLQKTPHIGSHDVVDWVLRHPAQFGISHAFAIYVSSDTMEPRYYRGELIYIHPGRPPEAGRDCIIEMNNGDTFITRFLRQTADKIRVAQFKPPLEADIDRDEIKAIYTVVGRS